MRDMTHVQGDRVDLATSATGPLLGRSVIMSMGATASMVWWPQSLVDGLAAAGYRVIRHDWRDTGASTTRAPGVPDYSVQDLADDLVAILDAYGVDAAHLVGMSLGGYVSQLVAAQHPHRVASLVLIASEPLNGDEDIPQQIDERLLAHFARAESLDWSNESAVVDFLLTTARLCSGRDRAFDEDRERKRVEQELSRTTSIRSAFNHALMGGEISDQWSVRDIRAPTLVIHGSDDPVIPSAAGRAIARQVADAELMMLEGAGHEMHSDDLPAMTAAVGGFLSRVDARRAERNLPLT